MAKNITPRAENYSQWYLDVIAAGQLADHAPVKGCMVIRPSGYAIWEEIQARLDRMFKETGHVNAYFPVLIPESFIRREAQHVEGFSPELAIVTHAGGKELEEPLVVRPTSETVIGHMYAQWVQSYRDLPLLINQWCNVMRWELRTRLFLRTTEFLWQEGHTAHETGAEAEAETLRMLDVYRRFQEETLAMPVLVGRKTESEKFPGALHTYCVEAMMQDKKALQNGTSHNLGQNFARAFEIQYLDRENVRRHVHTTSWGVSTRMIGGLLMTHSDDDGLVLPPRIAPVKAVVIPIYKSDEERSAVLPFAQQVQARLGAALDPLKVRLDDRADLRPADRFFHWVQQGVPLRVEVGPKDVQRGQAMLVRRDTRAKQPAALDALAETAQAVLERMQADLYDRARAFRDANTHRIDSYADFKALMAGEGGFALAHWNGSAEVERRIKEETKATIRLIPLDGEAEPGRCMVTGEPSPRRVLFAIAY
ncbi:MAG: proline--tRNA ligase [Candidatus Lambdaproteobacteria bacterium]|nr:proline--tRNA ligase [Candidatus Lambdaproteobacteria bacterium]